MNATSRQDERPPTAHEDSEAVALAELLAAGHRAVLVATPDEARAIEALSDAAASLGLEPCVLTLASGSAALDELLAATPKRGDKRLVIACDMFEHLDPAQRRRVREHAQRRQGAALAFVQTRAPDDRIVPPELPIHRVAPPDRERLAREFLEWLERAQRNLEPTFTDALGELHNLASELAREGLGLHCFEFRQACASALAQALAFDAAPTVQELRGALRAQKARRVHAGAVLEPASPVPVREVGGLSAFKAWLHRRALALDPAAQAVGIPLPRGVMLIGVQGCGKSLAARACADVLGLPIFRLDPGRLFEGLVGGSEAKLAETLATIDRMAPVVLWLDEVDKGLAGADSSSSDGGTTARVVGGLLTWLQERRRPVFVVATANDPGRLPPELQRRGRLDEVFFVDLPSAATRARILEIHLTVRPARELGEAPPLADKLDAFTDLARDAEGFSGAELEAALIEARLDAFARGEALAASDLHRALSSTVPLSRARRESVERLRQWAQDRARKA